MAAGLATEASTARTALAGRLTATAAVRVVGLGCTLLTALALARLLGADEFGRSMLALSWASGLGALALAGTDQLLLRELSVDGDAGGAALRTFVGRRARLTTAIASALVVVVALVLLGASLLPAAVAIVALLGAMRRGQALLLAEGRTGRALAGESIALPLLHLAIVIPVLWVVSTRHGAVAAVSAYAVALLLVVAGQAKVAGPALLSREPHEPTPAQQDAWRKSARTFALVNAAVIGQASIDLWILGGLGTHAEVGSYALAARLAALVTLPLTVTTYAMAREAAVLHAAGDTSLLQHQVTNASRLAAATAAVIAAAVLLVSPVVQPLLGRSFDHVTVPLLILVGGQLVNVVIGPVATLLLMTGHERDVRNTILVATAINAGLTVALVPSLGGLGAAIGAAVSLAWWNLVLRRRVYAALGVRAGPLVLSRLRHRRQGEVSGLHPR